MPFRYINPGYASLTGDSSVNTFESFSYNPQNGIAFSKIDSSYYNETKIPLPAAFTSDIWAKFNLYFDTRATGFYLGAKRKGTTSTIGTSCIGIYTTYNSIVLLAGRGTNVTGGQLGQYVSLSTKKSNLILFHIHIGEDAANSYGELSVNGVNQTFAFTNNNYRDCAFSEENSFFLAFPTSEAERVFVSELIVSDEEISPKEKIISLPVSDTFTNMTSGESGIFIANAVNQTLLQSVDVSDLIEQFGASSAVTGIALAAAPAYTTGVELTTLTGFSTDNGVATVHDSFSLSENVNSAIVDGWGLSGVTISDLQHMQFGWKAGA